MLASQIRSYAAPFDALAEDYDQKFTSSKIGQAQRASIWSELENTFRHGERILELGCGTGVDASFLAQRGVSVLGCDASPRMIAMAQQRIQRLTGIGTASVELHQIRAEEIGSLRELGPFEGAFSNFGVLNCVKDLRSLAINLAALLKPGAPALLCLMGPYCAWEMAWYLAQGRPGKAFRRLQRAGVSARLSDDATVDVHYPSVRSLVRTFLPEFRLKFLKGIGVSVPPSYAERWAVGFPRAFDLCVRSDSVLGRTPGIRSLADHILVKFEREGL